MSASSVDMLCFGAHPDDVEIGMGGTIKKHSELGWKVAICDLTFAELSSNGTIELRQQEAKRAAEILGVTQRLNLGLPDRGLFLQKEIIAKLVQVIRELKPKYVFAPFEEDRHPDHQAVGKLVEEAVFSAGIAKFSTNGEEQGAHRVAHLYYYFINGFAKPHLLVDVSSYVESKQAALLAYQSQFVPTANQVATRLNTNFLQVIEGRDQLYGKMLNLSYAEGFMSKEPLLVNHF